MCSACLADDSRWSDHADSRAWSGAFASLREDPWQKTPALVLAVGVPASFVLDSDIEEDAVAEQTFGTDAGVGDALAIGFGAAPLVMGALDAAGGDGGRSLETATESLAATMGVVYALKFAVGRERPDGNGSDSFPSGHTAMSFAGATWLARRIEASGGGKWGYALYLPAAYVAISRMEDDRHYLSDTVCGALLAVVATNMVWNAHEGDEQHGRPGVFTLGARAKVALESGAASDGRFVYGFTVGF